MVVKALFAFSGTPDLDALLGKPLHHERCLIIPPADAVEHENQQYVKLVEQCPLLDFHNGVAGVGVDFISGNALLRDFIDDLPIRMARRILAAGQLLHGNVIVIYLSDGGDAVKAYHPFHVFFTSRNARLSAWPARPRRLLRPVPPRRKPSLHRQADRPESQCFQGFRAGWHW